MSSQKDLITYRVQGTGLQNCNREEKKLAMTSLKKVDKERSWEAVGTG